MSKLAKQDAYIAIIYDSIIGNEYTGEDVDFHRQGVAGYLAYRKPLRFMQLLKFYGRTPTEFEQTQMQLGENNRYERVYNL